MKAVIEKSDLISMLSKTQNIVEKRNTMPVLTNILFEATNGKLKIFATDLEVSLTDEARADVTESGQIAVDAKNLFNIVRELEDNLVSLSRKPNNWIEIKQKKTVFNLVGLPPEEYPVFPSHSAQEFHQVTAAVMLGMIDKTIYSVSSDETRYHLNGVYFEMTPEAGKLRYRMVATDGHRMSMIDQLTTGSSKGWNGTGVIIPRKGLNEMRKLLEQNRDQQVDFAVEGSQIILKVGPTNLMVRLIEGRYPNYQQLIPQTTKLKLVVSREHFISSLRRVSLLSNQKSKGVTLTISADGMQIATTNPEMGDAKEEIEIEYKGEEIKIGFNARYLLEILTSMDSDGVDFSFNDHLSPGIMRQNTDASYTCIVMPMRI